MSNTYTTIQGDMWDGIAFKVYQSEYYMSDLIEANPQYRETVVFPANVVLTIPDVTPLTPQNLPPWKRVNS